MKWHIGCSGFSYKEWKGVFYPEKLAHRKWFSFYAEHFNTLELNVTFYRFPQLKFLQNWYDKSPEGFSFSVKVPRLITHYKKLVDCERMLSDFYNTCREGLKDKLGPVLFQFPPQFTYTDERLELLISTVDRSFINVAEFRHESWWREEVYTRLGRAKIIFCGQSYPKLPDDPEFNSNKMYYRFHGVPKLYYAQYDNKFLENIVNTTLKQSKVKEAFLYFNNTASLAAIANARHLLEYSRKKK